MSPESIQAESSTTALLDVPSNLDDRLMQTVKRNYDSQQQEAFLMLEAQLAQLAQHVKQLSR